MICYNKVLTGNKLIVHSQTRLENSFVFFVCNIKKMFSQDFSNTKYPVDNYKKIGFWDMFAYILCCCRNTENIDYYYSTDDE